MKKHRLFIYSFTALMLILSPELMATAETDYKLGLKSYKSGNNKSAAAYFESAMKQGMDSVSLKYNLASSYYKLGRYREAKIYFNQLHKIEKMRDLAEYNLGLIAIKEKNGSLARRYFNSIASTGKDEKLIKLSKKHLLALTKKEEPWKYYLFSNLGYDDNITFVSGDSVLDIADNFLELFASSDLLITGKRKDGWIANAFFYGINFLDTDSNDENKFSLGLKRTIKFNDWDNSIHFSLAKSTYAGDDFQRTTKLDLIGQKKVSKNQRLKLRYQAEDIRSDQTIYDYLEGWRQRARIEYRHYSKNNTKQIYYELEKNDRGVLVTTTDTYEYSPTRNTIHGKYTHILNKHWWLIADLSYRISDFQATETIDREDSQWTYALSTDYRLDKTFKLTAKYQYTDNDSTIDRYSYDKSIIKIGLSKLF